jgi:hypothetical protein
MASRKQTLVYMRNEVNKALQFERLDDGMKYVPSFIAMVRAFK